MNVNRAVYNGDIPAPSAVDQLGAGKNAPGVIGKKLQQPEFCGGKFDRFSVAAHFPPRQIDDQSPSPDQLGEWLRG
jgi:hypothetical protein